MWKKAAKNGSLWVNKKDKLALTITSYAGGYGLFIGNITKSEKKAHLIGSDKTYIETPVLLAQGKFEFLVSNAKDFMSKGVKSRININLKGGEFEE